MESSSVSGGAGICPVCSFSQENLAIHLANHSKDEIIESLALKNYVISRENIQSDQIPQPCVTESSLNVNQSRTTVDNVSQEECCVSRPLPSSSISMSGGTIFSTAPILPFSPSLPAPATILGGINNVTPLSSTVIPSNFPSVRSSYLQNGSASGISPFTPTNSLPLLYRHSSFQSPTENNSGSFFLQRPQFNVSAYKGFNGQQVGSSYSVDSSLINSSMPQPDLTLTNASNQLPSGPSTMASNTTSLKINSVIPDVNSGQVNNLPSTNIPGASLGQQTVLCVLPFTPIQPTIPTGGSYFLYGNSLVPAGTLMPEMLQSQGNLNYILSNGTGGLMMNGPQVPNQQIFIPSNMPSLGVKQDFNSISSLPCVNGRPLVTDSTVQTSITNFSGNSAPLSVNTSQASVNSNLTTVNSGFTSVNSGHASVNTSHSSMVTSHNETTLYAPSSPTFKNNSMDQEKNAANKNESKTVIEIGNNIKISLPKDVIEKKERLKELINRELVRALLLNDADQTSLLSTDAEVNFEYKIENPTDTSKNKGSNIAESPQMMHENSVTSDFHHSLNNSQIDQKSSVSTFTVSCNPSNAGYIDLNSIQIDSNMPPTSNSIMEDCNYKANEPVPLPKQDVGEPEEKLRNVRVSREHNFNHTSSGIIDLSSSSQIDNLFPSSKSPSKLSGSSKQKCPIVQSEVKLKNENQTSHDSFSEKSLTFLSATKNFPGLLSDAVFSDISYADDHVLGAVEEVFSSESPATPSASCKSTNLSLSKSSNCFAYGSSNLNFEDDLVHSLHDGDSIMHSSPTNDNFEASTPTYSANNFKYSKTYIRAKKFNNYANSSSSLDVNIPSFIADTCQINMKLQNLSDQTDEELVDDPLYEELDYSSSGLGQRESVSNVYPSRSPIREDESFSNDSKEVENSLFQRVPLKIENGESNGTHTEEIMSLKASETLADSDSERATPSEEIGEIFYGKSCIFAGEPGPPHLSPRVFPHLEVSETCVASHANELQSSLDHSSPNHSSFNGNEGRPNCFYETEENDNAETISLTLDANCSILPADALNLPQLFSQVNSNYESGPQEGEISNSFKDELWTKPTLTQWTRLSDDSKPFEPFVTTGIVESSSNVTSLASTSGLQNSDIGSMKKCCREEEEYDFEYESDCYGDSDSDVSHFHRGPLDLERWRCTKCNKTFKSLKEKLLHSGHHSPCSNGRFSFVENVKNSIEGTFSNNDQDKNAKKDVSVSCSSSELVTSTNESLNYSKTSTKKKLKEDKLTKKMKEEKKEVLPINDSQAIGDEFVTDGNFKCSECSQSFLSVDSLYEHRANVFKSRYICPVCHMEFKKRIDKLRHLKIHPLSGLKCLICNRLFDSYYSWSQHQLFHMGLVTFECKECGYKCQRKGELEIHCRKHSGERPFQCETCLSTFITSHSLKRHLIVHMEGQEIECDICHKKYKNAVGLNKHKLKAHPKKKKFLKKRTDFMCHICNEVFPSQKKLAWHQETHERWPKKCQLCGDCFIHQSNLTKHIRMKHDSSYVPVGAKKENNVSCPICKKVYKRSSISLHMRTHTGVKPYKCNVCSRQFTVKCNYLSHKWVHMGVRDRPFKCKLCERSFHRKRFLEAHIRSHKKIRPYTCNECGKSFIHKNNYQTHIKQHTEEKKHECEYCGKTFFRKYNLNNHVRVHTGETPYECTICRKEFTQKSNYNVHMKAFHVERHAVHEEV